MGENKFTIGARRPAGTRQERTKVTLELDPADAALLRVTARDWNVPLGVLAGVAIGSFVASGLAARGEAVVDEVGLQRIRSALARWEATSDKPVLDPSIHPGAVAGDGAGDEAGVSRSETPSLQAGCGKG